MTFRKAAGPNDLADRRPRKVEQLPGRLDRETTPDQAARQAVDELIANGAELRYRPAAGEILPSFTYELSAGGDRQRCRAIISEIRPRPLIWAAMLREIAARSEGSA